jgi:hypothetical protein
LAGRFPAFFFGTSPVSVELAEHIRGLARRVRRLLPSARDPEAFHVEKDAIAHDLLRLAGDIAPERRSSKAISGRMQTTTQIVVNGRLVTVQQRRHDFAI